MADNDEAGGSRPHAGSEEEDLENHYLQYFSQDLVDTGEDDGYEGTDNTTTDTGGAGTDGSAAKRQRKERHDDVDHTFVGRPKRKVWSSVAAVSLSMKPRFNRTSRSKKSLLKFVSGALTWNLHTTQSNYFAPTKQ